MHPNLYPVEPVKNMYVAPFGGFSGELEGGEIGLLRDALEANTTLNAGEDRVLVTTDRGGTATPVFAKPLFRVVALDNERPQACASSPRGEIVFSEADYGGSTYRIFDTLRNGSMVVLNATLAKRFPWFQVSGDGVFAKARFSAKAE